MLPYQMSMAVADQHIRDLMAEARHHSGELPEASPRLKALTTQMRSAFHIGGRASARSMAAASASGASPMGCRA